MEGWLLLEGCLSDRANLGSVCSGKGKINRGKFHVWLVAMPYLGIITEGRQERKLLSENPIQRKAGCNWVSFLLSRASAAESTTPSLTRRGVGKVLSQKSAASSLLWDAVRR